MKFNEPVRHRENKLKDDNRSLHLDIYSKGIRKYEYPKMYLVPEVSTEAKERNKQTMKVAEQIKAERILLLQSKGVAEWDSIKKASMPIALWFEQEYEHPCQELSVSAKRWRLQTRKKFTNYLDTIHRPNLALEEVDQTICCGFLNYLHTDGVKDSSQLQLCHVELS